MADEDSPVFDWPGPPGTWLDLADAHWLTDASLRAAAKLHPAGDWDVRRFRPTALIAVDGDDFAEDGWTKVQAGSVGTDVLMPTPRCSMPRSEEHTSELQSLMRISYAVFCLQKQ